MLSSSHLNLVNCSPLTITATFSKAQLNNSIPLALIPLVAPRRSTGKHLSQCPHDSHIDSHGYDDLSVLDMSYYDIMNIKGWPASQKKFLLAWKAQVCQYKELNGSNDNDDVRKLSLLQVAVSDAPSLARVKGNADILLGKSLTFDDYFNLLKSTAQQFDSVANRSTSGTKKMHRQTLRHDIHASHIDSHGYDDLSVLDMSYYDIMRTFQRTTRDTLPPRVCPCLGDDQWKDLEDKARTLLKSILAPNKAIILLYSTMP
jgi:hypothetical protein